MKRPRLPILSLAAHVAILAGCEPPSASTDAASNIAAQHITVPTTSVPEIREQLNKAHEHNDRRNEELLKVARP